MDILLKYCEVVTNMDILLKYCEVVTNMDILYHIVKWQQIWIFY